MVYCKRQKLYEKKVLQFSQTFMNRKGFPNECSVEKLLSLAHALQQKPRKVFLQ